MKVMWPMACVDAVSEAQRSELAGDLSVPKGGGGYPTAERKRQSK